MRIPLSMNFDDYKSQQISVAREITRAYRTKLLRRRQNLCLLLPLAGRLDSRTHECTSFGIRKEISLFAYTTLDVNARDVIERLSGFDVRLWL